MSPITSIQSSYIPNHHQISSPREGHSHFASEHYYRKLTTKYFEDNSKNGPWLNTVSTEWLGNVIEHCEDKRLVLIAKAELEYRKHREIGVQYDSPDENPRVAFHGFVIKAFEKSGEQFTHTIAKLTAGFRTLTVQYA